MSPMPLPAALPVNEVPQTEDATALRMENLSKCYPLGNSNHSGAALKEVTVTFTHGEFVAIMGPSGSGKSTFMNLLGCLDTPSTGQYWIENQELSTFSQDSLAQLRNRYFGFVFQSFNLLPRLTALDNIALPLRYGGHSRKASQTRARELLNTFHLSQLAVRLPNQLSGGQQQRIAIARALACQPRWILADEPTGNLDSQASQEVMELLSNLNATQGIGIILVTHETDIAAYAPRHIRFADGKLLSDCQSSLPL